MFPKIILPFLLAVFGCSKPQEPQQPIWPPGSTVVGRVTSGGAGLEGVVVSDGYITVQTDGQGLFSMESAKKHGYVFISTPSGYEVPTQGVRPQFYAYVGKHYTDTVNFELTAADQKNYSVFFLGDMHLAKKRNDLEQFKEFVDDLNALRAGKKCFAVTLGDMSWDTFWNQFDLTDYLAEVNRDFKGLQIYHTIGNHDHELGNGTSGDWDTAVTYKKKIGPTYYSFNVGGVHYMVLDDILCRNTIDGERASWNEIEDDEMEWIRKDLSYVSKDTPIVLAMHAPIYNETGGFYMYNGWDLVKLFTDYKEIYAFSGHTHVCYNNDYQKPGKIPVYEANSGAVCGAWWYTGYDYPKQKLNICPDGTPSGYRVFDVSERKFSWYYKSTGWPADYQFRIYDNRPSNGNEVLINVWDYDPEWTVSVTENGKALKVERLTDAEDPLYKKIGTYSPTATNHIFRVQAAESSSPLDIKVTDRFGRVYSDRTGTGK